VAEPEEDLLRGLGLGETIQIPSGNRSAPRSNQLLLNRYRLQGRVNQGGSSIIFEALDESLHRKVAVKVLRDCSLSDMVIEQFRSEAEIMASLPHPGIPPVFDMGRSDSGSLFIVMKFVEGEALSDILNQRSTPATGRYINVLSDIASTMAYAHSQGIIHLDLKPANVMVGGFSNTYVLDWGLARRIAVSGHESNQVRRVVGTPNYMAPEQALGAQLDRRTDVYGIGSILYEMLTGVPPHEGGSNTSIIQHVPEPLPRDCLERLDTCDAHPVLKRLALNCLDLDPAQRPESAVEVAHVLSSLQHSLFERTQTDMERFFEISLDMFCIAGLDGFFRRVNGNFTRVLGHSESQLLQTPFMEFVHPEDRDNTVERMSVLLEGQPVVRFRNRYVHAAGGYRVLEWTAKSIPEEEVIFAVARDVTSPNGPSLA